MQYLHPYAFPCSFPSQGKSHDYHINPILSLSLIIFLFSLPISAALNWPESMMKEI